MQKEQGVLVAIAAAIGIAVLVGAKYLTKAAVFAVAAGGGRVAANQAMDYFLAQPDGRPMVAGIASTGLSADSVLALFGDSSFHWFRRRSARDIATSLSPAEQAEVLQARIALARKLPIDQCAQAMWDGTQSSSADEAQELLSVLSQEQRDRLAFLSGRAIGFALQGLTTPVLAFNDDEWADLIEALAMSGEMEILLAATLSDSDPEIRCRGAVALYEIPLRTPDSDERARALKYILSVTAGR